MKPIIPVKEIIVAVIRADSTMHILVTCSVLIPRLLATSSPADIIFKFQEWRHRTTVEIEITGVMKANIGQLAIYIPPISQKTSSLICSSEAMYSMKESMAEKRNPIAIPARITVSGEAPRRRTIP